MKRIIAFAFLASLLIACDSTEDPAIDDRDKFIGTWNVSSTGTQSGTLAWSLTISTSNSTAAGVLLKNFDKQGTNTTVRGETSGNNISYYEIVSGDTISGTGVYSGGKITFDYTVKDGVSTDVVTATATK
ncbi:MAG: hypothetical protein RIQ89_2205 [Bacteroidota bacterium]|jgi:hypothetical protein